MRGAHLAIYLTGFYYWRAAFKQLLDAFMGRSNAPYITPRNRKEIVLEGRIHVILYITLAYYAYMLQWDWLVNYWLIPVLLGQPFLRLYVLAEHHDCDESDVMLNNSRTTYTNFFVRMLAWNMPYHTAHHTYPAVPFYKLPQLHAEMVAGMGREPETIGYLSYQYHMLRKLWREGTSKYDGKQLDSY